MNKPILWQDATMDSTPITHNNSGYKSLTLARTDTELRHLLPSASAIILHVPHAQLSEKQIAVTNMRRLPILWLCSETRPQKELQWGYSLDGILFPGMDRHQIDWATQAAGRSFLERKRWHEEKEQLLLRLEERKWVDQAKGILCEIKGITESEAYDFLRKQAMNERKRMGEVAASIVKVYQLFHG